jgi:hypothetical protein
MVDIVLLAASFTLELCHHPPRKNVTTRQTSSRERNTVGWISRKDLEPPVEAELFS